jgi:hypothetical protein
MNHKQLLALFLCFVMIFSSKIISLEVENNIVDVKNVSSNIDKYTIENIKEDEDKKSINIFYPVTKYENVNNMINEKINEYKEKFEESQYISDKKELVISFEEYEYNDIVSFKFNVKSNVGVTHDLSEVFTIVYKDDQIIDYNYLKEKNNESLDKIYEECKNRLKDNSNIKEYSTEKWIEDGTKKQEDCFTNFIIDKDNIVLIFNPCTVAPYVAGIIQIEIPNEILELNIE